MAALNRLSQRIKENFQETTRDLTLLAGSGSSTTYFDTSDDKLKEISKLLESRNERERLEGMKRIIAGMSKGRDMEGFFAQVVKNVVSQSIEIRKLVYIYLLRFASTNSDLLLLSINTFQKDLSDPSPLIRSMSLRVLTSIRVPVIQGIVMLGLKKLVHDRNPWVRKTVAGGLAKVYEMDNSSLNQLIPLLQTLLSSPSPLTLGPSLTAFLEICPERLDLLHPYYRHICSLVVDADDWGQAVALQVLLRYARSMLEKPDAAGAVRPSPAPTAEGEQNGSGQKADGDESDDEFAGIDEDLAMLLHCIKPLFQSRNPAVVLATANVYYHLAPAGHAIVGQELLVRPLLRLAGSSGERVGREEIAALAWEVIAEMVQERPWLFTPHQAAFFLHSTDSISVQTSKLQALSALVTPDNAKTSMREFKHYVRFPEDVVAEEAVRAIGTCVRTLPDVAASGLSTLMRLLKSERETLVAQAVIVLKSVILSQTQSLSPTSPLSALPSPQRLVARLAKGLDGIANPKARSSVFWLVGQFAGIEPSEEAGKKGLGWEGVAGWVPDVAQKGVKGFSEESTAAKLQVLTLLTKLLVLSPSAPQLVLMAQYLFSLARYDVDYDVRDRARFLHALLRGVRGDKSLGANGTVDGADGSEDTNGVVDSAEQEEADTGGVILRREQVRVVVLGNREVGELDVMPSAPGSGGFDVGSMSRLTGKKLAGYEDLPEWTDDPTDSSLRDSELDNPQPSPSYTSQQRTPGLTPGGAPSPVPGPVHISSAASLPKRSLPGSAANASPMDSSPAGSVPHGVKSKFQDLDSFLNSEGESESESETETEGSSDEGVGGEAGTGTGEGVRAVVPPPRRDIVPEYSYDETSSEGTEETESEDESSDAGEGDRLYSR
ncbi:hypothetical protein IAT38_001179 [Cryptococcus sp. DSM 104549]